MSWPWVIFALRGQRAIDALERQTHRRRQAAVHENRELDSHRVAGPLQASQVGCMLDLPNLGPYITLRGAIRRGAIGEVHTVTFLGIHPLNYGKRPAWYFKPGKHGHPQ